MKEDTSGKGFFLSQDSDCHWYVVPEENTEEWYQWAELDSEDERSWTPPEFAIRLGGSPSRVIFKHWRIT